MNSVATMEPLPIFVYGTLMRGQPNDYIWQDNIRRIEPALAENYGLYDFRFYPMMVEEPGYQVRGQLIWVKQARFSHVLQNLDALEGFDPLRPHDSAFRRVQAQITMPSGRGIVAWTYVGAKGYVQYLPNIDSGDWAKYLADESE